MNRITPKLALCAALTFVVVHPAVAQVGLTVSHEDDLVSRLYRLNLRTGSFQEASNLGTLVSFAAMDRGPGGLLYGLEWGGKLYSVHPETGDTNLVGELQLTQPTGLAFDSDGDLWVVAGQTLARIDPGTAVVVESLTLDRELVALAGDGQQLFGFSEFWHLWTIDTDRGELTSVSELSLPFDWLDADFDDSGTLWIVGFTSGPIMGTVGSGVMSIPEPSSGQAIEHHFWSVDLGNDSDPRAHLQGLVVEPLRVVDIPTLGGTGAAVLAALLAGLGLYAVRRRQ